MLKPQAAFTLLLERGLLDACDVVRGALSIQDCSSRNRNLRLSCSTRPGYFLKQAEKGDVIGTLQVEAEFYRRCHNDPAFSRLRPFIPTFVLYDTSKDVLAIELVRDAVGGHKLAAISVDDDPLLAAQLASALAACHSICKEDDHKRLAWFQEMNPWAFNLAFPTPEIFREITPLQLQMLRLIQRSPQIMRQFRHLRHSWSCACLIHGDVRWENLLASRRVIGGERLSSLRLIDWESVGLGDPAWDVASAFHMYLAYALRSIPLATAGSPAQAAELFAARLPELRPHLQALWETYVDDARLSPRVARRFLTRALRYCGVRLLQFAFESLQSIQRMPRFTLCGIQLAFNILGQSRQATASALGVS